MVDKRADRVMEHYLPNGKRTKGKSGSFRDVRVKQKRIVPRLCLRMRISRLEVRKDIRSRTSGGVLPEERSASTSLMEKGRKNKKGKGGREGLLQVQRTGRGQRGPRSHNEGRYPSQS